MEDGSSQTVETRSKKGAPVTGPTRSSWRLRADPEAERPDAAVVRRLVLGSALMLFLELALILSLIHI